MEDYEKPFVTHTCKRCGKAFVAEDTYNAQDLPPKNKYCGDCEKEGFKNKRKRKLTPEQIEAFKERMALARKRKQDER